MNQVVVKSGHNEHLDQGVQQGFTCFSHVMDKLKEAQVEGQFFLRDTSVRSQPGAQKRPEAFDGVDVDFAL